MEVFGEMVGDLRVDPSVTIPAGELEWRFSGAATPGRLRNELDAANQISVELRFNVVASAAIPEPLKALALVRLRARLVDGTLIIRATAHRTREDNERSAAAKLCAILGRAMAPRRS